MEIYKLINTTTEQEFCGNIVEVLNKFVSLGYPVEYKIAHENGQVLICENETFDNTSKKVEQMLDTFCKKCPKCGSLLPKESFSKNARNYDGLQQYCKDCCNKAQREQYAKRKESTIDKKWSKGNMPKVYSNPELAKFTPRELMAELKARGFEWDYMLEPRREIKYSKI